MPEEDEERRAKRWEAVLDPLEVCNLARERQCARHHLHVGSAVGCGTGAICAKIESFLIIRAIIPSICRCVPIALQAEGICECSFLSNGEQ